ncbi:M56 family metallopeptidase [uncultured Algibacter sp.]|uniref:M56 family metallopeptidase n=1 Tax=uncultured Algibacter sp. TaxID=298659 RepID=UPI002620B3CF|nr:M56 family metallopeptidase [uncultured Algibacter sp.]
MEYLIKVSAVIAIFYIIYKVFLDRYTFFESNRWFLLFGLITAFAIPFLVIPVYIESSPAIVPDYLYAGTTSNVVEQRATFNLVDTITSIYLLGLVAFSIRFIIQIAALFLIIIKNKKEKEGHYIFIKTNSNISPFSFFNWIVYNPKDYSQTELSLIIAHEKVHACQFHSVDVLLTQLSCIILWFNPFIWLYNKDLKQNLEFIADKNAQQNSNCKKSYQYTLLKTSMPTHQLALSNNFYNSLIKKRIVMLQKSKSKKINQIKYILVVPLLTLFLMSFNTKTIFIEKENPLINELNSFNFNEDKPETEQQTNLIAEEPIINKEYGNTKETKKESKPSIVNNNLDKAKNVQDFIITKNSSDADLDKLISKIKAAGVDIKFKGVKRNSKGEITSIKIEAKSKNSNASFNLNSDETIEPIKISFKKGGKNLSIGNTSAIHRLHTSGKDHNVFIYSDEDDDRKIHKITGDSIHYTYATKKGKYHVLSKNKKVEIISSDDSDGEVEVIIESDDDNDENHEEDAIIIKNGKTITTSNKGSNTFKVKTLGNSKSDSKIIITSDDKEQPLFIVDGEEYEKTGIDDIKPDNIESINVLKGESAEKKYGNKGKNGVVEIITKKKK